ncbi:MAG: DUF6607 family protein [Chitinophagales bacterium]|nr:hypothetical protein [Bacteroidota bacterium]
MFKLNLFTLLFLMMSSALYAEEMNVSKMEKDKETLKKLCGCFEVDFKYKETFGYPKDYKLKDKYHEEALEWVSYEPQQDGSIKMQHILIVDKDMFVKHWREDWSYENNTIYQYDKDYQWKRVVLPADKVKGTWTQKVFEVSDRPQYDGVATFNYFDDKILWQSNEDAPLPRREYSKRSDYNVLNRLNRLYISESGYLHEQDNKKIARHDGVTDTLIAEEKGYNTYTKVAESKCQSAIDWWEKNKIYWNDVRAVWDEIIPTRDDLKMNRIVNGKALHEKLFALNKELIDAKKYNSDKAKELILKTINEHLVSQ